MGSQMQPGTPFEPGMLGDPVALMTAWTPCKSGGTNFCTHRLVKSNDQRVSFRPTGTAIFLALLVMAFGVIPLAPVPTLLGNKQLPIIPLVMLGFFGLVFVAAGLLFLRAFTRPIVFDKKLNLFGRSLTPERGRPGTVELGEVHALQVISEYCGGKSSFYSYELNLVLKDGRRVNVIDHGSLRYVQEDGAELAAFLGVPLWDPALVVCASERATNPLVRA